MASWASITESYWMQLRKGQWHTEGTLQRAKGKETVTRYKSSMVANIRAQLSVALHAGMSGKMLKHISAQVVGHGAAGLTMLQRSGAPRPTCLPIQMQ